jgi:hypothetical protein
MDKTKPVMAKVVEYSILLFAILNEKYPARIIDMTITIE